MNRYILLFTFILFIPFKANGIEFSKDAEYNRAINHSFKAILAYPAVKKQKKKIENEIYSKIPLEKETLAIIGSVATTASRGEVNTRVIKKMDFRVFGGRMRPDVNYNFKNGSARGTFNINWNW